jgi:putative addiction module CopG family antidote
MENTESIQVQLPHDMITNLNEAVASGQYHALSEIVQAALLQWQALQHSPLAHLEELRALCDEGEASGDAAPFTLEELLAEIRKPA